MTTEQLNGVAGSVMLILVVWLYHHLTITTEIIFRWSTMSEERAKVLQRQSLSYAIAYSMLGITMISCALLVPEKMKWLFLGGWAITALWILIHAALEKWPD